MNYDIVKAIEEVIEECKAGGRGRLQRKDDRGNVTLWLEAEWVEHWDGTHDIIELYFCYNDTGNVAYSKYIERNYDRKRIIEENAISFD